MGSATATGPRCDGALYSSRGGGLEVQALWLGRRRIGLYGDLRDRLEREDPDVVVGYKCHPHTDMAETATKALDILERRIKGEVRPVAAI